MAELRPNQEAKRAVINELVDKIKRAKAFVMVEYKGITVEADTKLRRAYREANIDYGVHKNTLMRIALAEAGYQEDQADYDKFSQCLNGTTAIAFSYDDEIAPAKVTKENADKINVLKIKGGMMDGKFVDAATVESLAKIPSKPVLLGMLANVLNAPVQGIAIALKAVADKKEA